jgi:hypothetical protein
MDLKAFNVHLNFYTISIGFMARYQFNLLIYKDVVIIQAYAWPSGSEFFFTNWRTNFYSVNQRKR